MRVTLPRKPCDRRGGRPAVRISGFDSLRDLESPEPMYRVRSQELSDTSVPHSSIIIIATIIIIIVTIINIT